MFKIFAVREECDPPVYLLGTEESLDFDPDTKWEDEGSVPEGYEIVALNTETGNVLWLEDDWTLGEDTDPRLLSDDVPVWVPPVDETYRPLPAPVDYSGERFRFEGLENGLDYTSLSDAVQMSRIWDSGEVLVVVSSSGGRWRVRDGLLLV